MVAEGGVAVLTGAGISTDSGIPDSRGPDGVQARHAPMTYQTFTGDEAARRFTPAEGDFAHRYTNPPGVDVHLAGIGKRGSQIGRREGLRRSAGSHESNYSTRPTRRRERVADPGSALAPHRAAAALVAQQETPGHTPSIADGDHAFRRSVPAR